MIDNSSTAVSDLRSMDLNLLVALRALLDEKHVSRAADRAGLSQPGMSRALQRLRLMFEDQLLVKAGKEYELTPRAVAIDLALKRVLSDIRDLVSPPTFDPASANGVLRIGGLDYEHFTLMPLINNKIRRLAPGLRLKAIPQDGLDFSHLVKGDSHLVLTAYQHVPPSLYRLPLFKETNACICAANHPILKQPFSKKAFKKLEHVWADIITGEDPGGVDQALMANGLTRNIVYKVPTFLLAIATVAKTQLAAIIPRQIALPFVDLGLVATIEMPFEFPYFTIFQYWHERYHKDAQHIWLRNIVVEAANSLNFGSGPRYEDAG
jgi:DNA-binding transcriptional LysR family regulator